MEEGITAYYWLTAIAIFGVILFSTEFKKNK